MATRVFVGRERELRYLQTFLTRALEGQGQVVFVAGDAGSGKTALLREFAEISQNVSADLVVAVGECNAQTGIGDPYLPFREILAMLSGDVDAKLARGTITPENADRLRALLRVSGQALVELGPHLLNFFLPGTLLAALAGRFVVGKVGWLKPLEQLNQRQPIAENEGGLDQSHLFEQYTDVLKAIAAKQPLILVVDDLQWADAGSTSLLFHLARRINESRILLVGAYRPDEIALGRGGARHPLDKVLTECKRYMGDIVLDLDEAAEAENREFVDAFLESEPNCLGTGFHEALLRHTGGHALFTVELLRTMQERGDLQKDEQGRWVESRTLDWATLPARVEGVIEERIGRLAGELREILRVASVEGTDFTAQVIARVQQVRERQLLHDLSEELEKRHRLVREQGETRVDGQVLSRYQFSHALFQRYLYDDLSAGERRLLHGEVAHVLEELYAGHTDVITVQLAYHYWEAGEAEQAVEYLIRAGDAAIRSFALPEARLHFGKALQALARLPDTAENRRQRLQTILKQGQVSFAAEGTGRQREFLAQAESLADQLVRQPDAPVEDRVGLARIRFMIGLTHFMDGELRKALTYGEQAVVMAKELGNEEIQAMAANLIGMTLSLQGRYDAAVRTLEQTKTQLAHFGNWGLVPWASAWLGRSLAQRGEYVAGVAEGQRALVHAHEINYPLAIATCHLCLGSSYLLGGDFPKTLDAGRAALKIAEETDEFHYVYMANCLVAWAETAMGEHQQAWETMTKNTEIEQVLGGRPPWSDIFTVLKAQVALNQGDLERAVTMAQQGLMLAQARDGLATQGWAHRVLGQAMAAMKPPRWDEVESHMAASLYAHEQGAARPEAARTLVIWGNLCRERGDLQAAHEHFEQAVAVLEQTDLTEELERTRATLTEIK